MVNRYPNTSIWITEYALADANLSDSQSFFQTSAEYFDRIDYIERYSYFGSFRSSVSNVGPNAAMLTQDGLLTDIGSWYLGGAATGNEPASGNSTSSSNDSDHGPTCQMGLGFVVGIFTMVVVFNVA
jgi:hypothetical protein